VRVPATLLGVAASLALVQPVAAQIAVGTSVGMFVPLGGWHHVEGGQPIERRNMPAAIFGGRVDYWLSERFGLEGVLALTPSQVAISDPAQTQDVTAGVFAASVVGLAKVLSIGYGGNHRGHNEWDIYVGAGGAIMSRFGTAWEGWTGTTHPAGILALISTSPIGRSVNLRFGFEDFISKARFKNAGLTTETNASLRHELVVTLGFMVRMGGR